MDKTIALQFEPVDGPFSLTAGHHKVQTAAYDNAVITAVVVSRDRPIELGKTVSAVLAQDIPGYIDVIVVDSSAHFDGIRQVTDGRAKVRVVKSAINLGGAGAFALGILTAMAQGADWLWLMDNDGRPQNHAVLGELLRTTVERALDAVSPAVVAAEDTTYFAFPYAVNGRYVFRRDDLDANAFLKSSAHLFNGLLIKTSALFTVGLPDLRMFARGDEVDFLHRMRRAGLPFGTTTSAAFLHPSSKEEIHPIWRGKLHVVIPKMPWKRRCQFRNRGYIHLRHRKWLILAVDVVRYPYFFLILRRGDVAGLKEWFTCTLAGLRGEVGRDKLSQSPLDLSVQ